jgi:hypothetical protein
MSSDFRRPRLRRTAPLAAVLLVVLAGCGKKGDPMPAPRSIPATVQDLTLRQRGEQVLLEFAHPTSTVAGLPLAGLDSVSLLELERPAPAEGATVTVVDAELAAARPVAELSGATLSGALVGDRVRIAALLPSPLPEPAVARVYVVRTRAATPKGPGELSGFSNRAILVPRPAPPAPASFDVAAERDGIRLSWSPVEAAAGGYAVYRRPAVQPDWGAPLVSLDSTVTQWQDIGAKYGQRYIYTVLALAQAEPPIESAPRSEREVDYQDRFPPATPGGLRAVALPGEVRLLWEASPDADVTGYRIERATGDGDFVPLPGAPATGLEQVDGGLTTGLRYRYRVLAIDSAGNLSAPSAPAEAVLP